MESVIEASNSEDFLATIGLPGLFAKMEDLYRHFNPFQLLVTRGLLSFALLFLCCARLVSAAPFGGCVPPKLPELTLSTTVAVPDSWHFAGCSSLPVAPESFPRSHDDKRLPKSPTKSGQHLFWDSENILLFSAVGASRALDYSSTLNFRRRGLDEVFLTNGIVDNHPLFAAIEVAGTAASIGASYFFHRSHHHSLERWTSIIHVMLGVACMQTLSGVILGLFAALPDGARPELAYRALFGFMCVVLLAAVTVYGRSRDVKPSEERYARNA